MNLEVPCNRNEPDYPCVAPRWVKAAFHFSHWLIKTTFLAAKTDWTEKIAKEKTHRPKAHPISGLEENWNYKRGKKNCRGLKNQ